MAEKLFLNSKVRFTRARKLVAEVLYEQNEHPDAEQIHENLRKKGHKLSLATVYRTLSLFEAHKLVEAHDFGDGRSRYEWRTETHKNHHHHIIDIETGKVIEFRNETLEIIKNRIARENGFKIVDERLELFCTPIPKK